MQTLREYMEIIAEADNFVGGFDGRNGYFEVFKNPSRAQLNKIMQHGVARMFLLDAQDAIAWSPYGALHGELIYLGGEDLNLPRNALPMVAYIAGNKVSCDVTDASRRTDWYHNPATAAFIKQHAYLRKMFGSIEVTYFDEDIDGKWDEMTNESPLDERVQKLPYKDFTGKEIELLAVWNPSANQAVNLLDKSVQSQLRVLVTDAKNIVVWDAYYVHHDDMIMALGLDPSDYQGRASKMFLYVDEEGTYSISPKALKQSKNPAIARLLSGGFQPLVENLTEARMVMTPAMEQLRQQFYFHLDNPGGDWLKYERERVAQRGKGGGMTAGLRGKDGGPEPALPLALLSKLAGARGEVRTATNPQVMKYAELMKTSGYTGEPLMIYVEFDGSATVGEGNHRIAAARLAGIPRLPVDVRYYTGAEQEVGLMSPDNIIKVVTAWDGDGRA